MTLASRNTEPEHFFGKPRPASRATPSTQAAVCRKKCSGSVFRLANVNGGTPHRIGAWDELDRALIGDFLGRLVVDSYREVGFFVSALVVSREERTPGKGFYDLARQVGALKSKDKYVELEFWMKHVNSAREWYSSRAR